MSKGMLENFYVKVLPELSICPMPGQLTVVRDMPLQGRQVVFRPRSFKVVGEIRPRIDLVAYSGAAIDYAGWGHADLLLQNAAKIPVQYEDKLILFPGTMLAEEDGCIHVPSLIRQGNRWGRSTVLLQGEFPLRAEVIVFEIEVFE